MSYNVLNKILNNAEQSSNSQLDKRVGNAVPALSWILLARLASLVVLG